VIQRVTARAAQPGERAELHFLPDSERLARAICRCAGMRARAVELHRFPDAEHRVRVQPTKAGTAVLFAQLHEPDAKLFPVLLAVDALRRSGVEEIRLLVPYLPYMRQDVVFQQGEAVSQRVLAQLLGSAVDEVVTLEPHLHRITDLEEVFPCRARALDSAPLLANWCRGGAGPSFLVGPDEESAPWIRSLAAAARLPWVVCRKQRLGDDRVRVTVPELPPAGRAILVDDIASSGTTLATVAEALRAHGVEEIAAVIVHAIFAPGALERIRAAGIEELVSTDSIPHETNEIATAPYFAEAIAADAPANRSFGEPACSD
jgi:ribose-phosphate pyrophosphokinase